MGTQYNLKQSSKLLGVDPKTLRKWIYDMHIDPPEGDDRRSRILTSTELQSIADKHRPTLKTDPEKTSTLNDAHPNYPERKLNQFRTEIRHAQSEVDKLKERLNRLEKRLQAQEDKFDKEIRAMHQKISDLETLLNKHLYHH